VSRRLPRPVLQPRRGVVSRRRRGLLLLRSVAGGRRRHRLHALKQQQQHAGSRWVAVCIVLHLCPLGGEGGSRREPALYFVGCFWCEGYSRSCAYSSSFWCVWGCGGGRRRHRPHVLRQQKQHAGSSELTLRLRSVAGCTVHVHVCFKMAGRQQCMCVCQGSC
jgi:hypothetical protein